MFLFLYCRKLEIVLGKLGKNGIYDFIRGKIGNIYEKLEIVVDELFFRDLCECVWMWDNRNKFFVLFFYLVLFYEDDFFN